LDIGIISVRRIAIPKSLRGRGVRRDNQEQAEQQTPHFGAPAFTDKIGVVRVVSMTSAVMTMSPMAAAVVEAGPALLLFQVGVPVSEEGQVESVGVGAPFLDRCSVLCNCDRGGKARTHAGRNHTASKNGAGSVHRRYRQSRSSRRTTNTFGHYAGLGICPVGCRPCRRSSSFGFRRSCHWGR